MNPENPVTELTSEQIAKIFTGEITNWSELGGNDAEIAVFGRDSASGTRSAFEEILGIEDKCAYLNEYSTCLLYTSPALVFMQTALSGSCAK